MKQQEVMQKPRTLAEIVRAICEPVGHKDSDWLLITEDEINNLERLKAEAEGKAEAYQQMGWFLQQAIETSSPHSVRVWKSLAAECLANALKARNEKKRGTVEWVKLEAMRQVYAHLLKRWMIPPDECLDRLFQDLQ